MRRYRNATPAVNSTTEISSIVAAVGSPGTKSTETPPPIAIANAIRQNQRVRRISSRSSAWSGEPIVVEPPFVSEAPDRAPEPPDDGVMLGAAVGEGVRRDGRSASTAGGSAVATGSATVARSSSSGAAPSATSDEDSAITGSRYCGYDSRSR